MNQIDRKELRAEIERKLLETGRDGMDVLLDYMLECGFYDAPCSTQYHLAQDGGLALHSLNVCRLAEKLAEILEPELDLASVRIAALLHDLGKAGQFGKPGYVPNYTKGRATKANPNPEPVRSIKKPFESNPELLYVDHEVRSIQIATQFIHLTEEENWAILMHNGMYGTFKYQIQGKETPLYLILHMSDMWASRVLENEREGSDGETEA